MAAIEKAIIQSYAPPHHFERASIPHNFFFDIPLQSREVAKQINVFEKQPVFECMKLSASMTLPVFEAGNFEFSDLQRDPLRGILQDKEEFLKQVKEYAKIARAKSAEDPEFARTLRNSVNKESFVAYHNAVNLAECLANDRHPYFSESYVWLPVGGGIKHLSLGNKNFIIAPDGIKFDQIRAIPVNENGGWKQSGPVTRVQCNSGERTLQIVTSKRKSKGYIGVRRLQGFNVFRCKPSDDSGSLKFREIINVSDPEALIALDISTINGESACTIDKSNKVKIYDIAAGKCLVDHQIDGKDCSNRPTENDRSDAKFIQFSKQPSLLYVVNKRKVYLKDTRVPFSSPGTTFNIYDLSEGCESLSACEESVISDFLYCSASHHTLTLDPRRGWLKRWNHGLDNMPLYLSVGVTEPMKEMVVTSSIDIGSSSGILNTWTETEGGLSQSRCSLPATLPSILDTSIWANSNGFWLEPSIAKRVESSLCGVTLIPNQSTSGFSLFSLNALGDIFSTAFQPDEKIGSSPFLRQIPSKSKSRTQELDCVKQWEETHANLIKQSQIDLHCETLMDRSYLLTVMKQHRNKDGLMRGRIARWKKAISKGRGVSRPRPFLDKEKPLRQEKLEKIRACKDWMACELLPFWDMDNLINQARSHNREKVPTLTILSDESE